MRFAATRRRAAGRAPTSWTWSSSPPRTRPTSRSRTAALEAGPAGRRGQAARRHGRRGPRAGRARRRARPAALRLPEPPLGQRLPDPAQAARRRASSATCSASSPASSGGGRSPRAAGASPATRRRSAVCCTTSAATVVDQALTLFGPAASVYAESDVRRPGARDRRRHLHRDHARERRPLPPVRQRDHRPARPALPGAGLAGGLREVRPRPAGGGPARGRAARRPARRGAWSPRPLWGRVGAGESPLTGGGGPVPTAPGRLPRVLRGRGRRPARRRPEPGHRAARRPPRWTSWRRPAGRPARAWR